MSKQDRAEKRRNEKAQRQLEGRNYTYAQVQSLVMQRDRLVQKMYSGLRLEVEKLGYKVNYKEGIWSLDKIEMATTPCENAKEQFYDSLSQD